MYLAFAIALVPRLTKIIIFFKVFVVCMKRSTNEDKANRIIISVKKIPRKTKSTKYHTIILLSIYNKRLNSKKIADKNTIVSFLSTLFSLRALLNYQKKTLDVLIINFVHSLLSSCATQVPFICLMIKRNDNEEAKVFTFSHISPINQMHFSYFCKNIKRYFVTFLI